MEYKVTPNQPEILDERSVKGIAAVFGNIDSGNDRIHIGAFKKTLKENQRRLKHLWQHDYFAPPTAVITNIEEVRKEGLPKDITEAIPEVTGGLMVTRKYLETPRGDEILEGIKKGAITEMSFAFDPVKFSYVEDKTTGVMVRELNELRLWETSDVIWGMNALTLASSKALHSAVPYKDTGIASEGSSWSSPSLDDFTDADWGDLTDQEKKRIAAHFAYAEQMPPESFGDLKLPHHQASKSGIGPAIWAGTKSAMGALMGATKGGLGIPSDARRSVYDHLASHYKQFEKEAPEYKAVDLIAAATIFDVLSYKEGRVLSSRNLEKLKGALQVLSDILLSAEPADDDEKSLSLLTEQLNKRIAIMERDPVHLF